MKIPCLLFAVPILLATCSKQTDQQIVFAPKAFHDSSNVVGDGFVYVAGTLTGEGVPYKNNTVAIACYKDRMECLTYSLDQIGQNQVGRLGWPTTYPVAKWDPYQVVASGAADAVDCRKTTISIVRKSQTVVWVEEPINQSTASCKDADTRLLKWSVEDSPGWKALHFRK